MTYSAQTETPPRTPGGLSRYVWLPIPLLVIAMVVFWATDLRTSFESPRLLMAVDFLTRTLACLFIVSLAGRSFLGCGAPGLLLLGCGVAIWGISGFVTTSILTHKDANLGVAISNLGIWLAALCHLAGVILSLRSKLTLRPAGLWLAAGYTLAVGFVGFIVFLAFSGWLPVFFVEGQGSMPVRHMVLGSSLAMFAFTVVLLWEGNRPTLSRFVYWYTLALLLIAAAIFGMMLQSSRNSLLNWTCRSTQYLSGIYMLVAALASRRASGMGEITPTRATTQARYRCGVAIVIVLAAAAVRLAFLPTLGTRAAFVTFYPAVMLAALYGGFRAGLLATALSAALVNYFWMEPAGHFCMKDAGDWLSVAIFFLSCLLISWITESMHRAKARAASAEAEATIAAERGRAAEALRLTYGRLQTFFDHRIGGIGIVITNAKGDIILANDYYLAILGCRRDELQSGQVRWRELTPPEWLPADEKALDQLRERGVCDPFEKEYVRRDGSRVPVLITDAMMPGDSGEILAFVFDITERKRAEANQVLLTEILRLLNRGGDLCSLVAETLRLIRQATGFDAVGLRLRQGDDCPYYEQNGFSDEFLREENFLCARGADGAIVRDPSGRPILECTCGLVLSGRTDPSMSCFTEAGSFWSNVSSELLALAPQDDPRTNPRNRCIHAGYQSVGLFPVRSGQEILGVLQLNDRREGRFTPDLIRFYESIAQNIGLALQRTAAEEALRESEARLAHAQEIAHLGSWDLDLTRNGLLWSDEVYRIFGLEPREFAATYEAFLDHIHPHDRAAVDAAYSGSVREGRDSYEIEHRVVRKATGEVRWVHEKCRHVRDAAGKIVRSLGMVLDITERKQAEREREIAIEFLRLVNQSSGTRPLVEAATRFFQQQSGCEAVGIRLHDGDDYPYFEAHGFPEQFLRLENSLCVRNAKGQIQRDDAGNPVMACMCGNVICGRSDPSKPFFTPAGSFWTNDTTGLLATTTEADRQTSTRNRCNGMGYESVALIPLRCGEERLGLLQFNDRRNGMFTPGTITLWERLAGYLAVALANTQSGEALRQLSQRLTYHVDHSPLAVIEWGADMRLIRWSGEAERMFGWKAAEVLGKRMEDFRWIYDEDQAQVNEVRIDLESGTNPRRFSANRNYHKDGSVLHCEWYNSSLLDESGKMRSLLSLVLDVTERTQAEEALRQAQTQLKAHAEDLEKIVASRTAKLHETISELEHFSYAIVHDMRAPLRAMQGFSSTIEEEWGSDDRSLSKECFRRIKIASSRMDQLITDSLSYSAAARQELILQPVDLFQLLDGLVQTYPNLQSDQADIQIDPRLPAVLGNEAALTQCFSNLLGNAVKFTKAGAKPNIRVWAEEVRSAEGGVRNKEEFNAATESLAAANSALRTPHSAFVRVWVEDDGMGIPQAALHRVFGMFQRATKSREGTGIGLAIVRKVVERMGGKVGVESIEDHGSRFWVELPRA